MLYHNPSHSPSTLIGFPAICVQQTFQRKIPSPQAIAKATLPNNGDGLVSHHPRFRYLGLVEDQSSGQPLWLRRQLHKPTHWYVTQHVSPGFPFRTNSRKVVEDKQDKYQTPSASDGKSRWDNYTSNDLIELKVRVSLTSP